MSEDVDTPLQSSTPASDGRQLFRKEIKSCGICYRNKVKCDRVFPCKRCVSRGLAELCEKETRLVNGLVSGSNRENRRQPSYVQLREENRLLHRKIASQERLLRSVPAKTEVRTEEDDDDHSSNTTPEMSPTGVAAAGSSVLDPSEFLTQINQVWGLPQYPSTLTHKSTRFTQTKPHTLESIRSLVPLEQSSRLVRFHCDYLHWEHPVFHVPSFLVEHDRWLVDLTLDRPTSVSFDFVALYFAIISCSLYFIDDEDAREMGFAPSESKPKVASAEEKAAALVLPRFWFELSVDCLQISGFMAYPTFYSLQTICILPLVAHAFDASAFVNTLLHTALEIARRSNFHLAEADCSPTLFGGLVQIEFIKRIWWYLITNDSLHEAASPRFFHIYSGEWTTTPANIDDRDLIEGRQITSLPSHILTPMSYTLVMGRIAEIFRNLNQSCARQKSVTTRFQLVKEADKQLEALFNELPELGIRANETWPTHFFSEDPLDSRFRSCFLLATMPKRIMLYRWFMGESYTMSRYAEVRQVCLQEARGIVSCRNWSVPPMFLKHWRIAFTMILCGMELGAELLQGSQDHAAQETLRDEIHDVVVFLRRQASPSALISRGAEILENILGRSNGKSPSTDSAIITDLNSAS